MTTTDNGGSLPERLGEYPILHRLAQGARTTIFEALDPRTSEPVAIKCVDRGGPASLVRLKNEFRLLATVHHPNVVSAYHLFHDRGRLFFTMELVRGVGFIDGLCVERPGAITHRACSNYDALRHAFRQLAQGVRAVHDSGFLHRNVTHEHVLVTDHGRVVLVGFGYVHEYGAGSELGMGDGLVVGTPTYMSPEQGMGEPVGPPTDWYAVGVLLYEALTGRIPFANKDPLALMAAKIEGRPPAPSSQASGIPEVLEALCMALLECDPGARPSAEQVLACLD